MQLIRRIPLLATLSIVVWLLIYGLSKNTFRSSLSLDRLSGYSRLGADNSSPLKKLHLISRFDMVDVSSPKLTDEELLLYINNCRAEHPSIIYYNRVPKCGSSTLQKYIADLSKKSQSSDRPFTKWSYLPETTVDHPMKDPYELYISKEEAEFRRREMLQMMPAIFDSHTVYYSYFPVQAHNTVTGYGDISYFNVVREPLERLVSFRSFQCRMFGVCNSTFIGTMNYLRNEQMSYLCGHQEECKARDENSLYIAKVRLVHSYSVVGIMEKMSETTAILRKIFPDFFTSEYDGGRENVGKDEVSKTFQVTTEQQSLFRKVNAYDIAFYEFAKKAFARKLQLCDLNPPV